MTKFYSCENANRVIAGVAFSVTQIVASTAWGVYATDDPDIIAKLDAEVANPRSAVTAITEAEYNAELEAQKKMSGWPISSPSRTKPEPTGPIKGQIAALVNEAPPEVPEENPDAPIVVTSGETTVEEALSTAAVEVAQPPADEPKKGKKAKG